MVYIRSLSIIVVKGRKMVDIIHEYDVLLSARLPKLFKRAKVIAIPKPGKDGSDPAYYRLISLLSVM
jgi:hypothetical protein